MRTIILTLLTIAFTVSAAMAITVDINGTDYTLANATKNYDFIRNSNGSSDGGLNHINIVDYILKNRLGAGNHTYTLMNGSSNSNPVDTWLANGAVSVMIDEIAGYAPNNTFGYYTIGSNNVANKTQLYLGSDSKTVNANKAFTLSSPAEFGFYLGVPNTGNTYFTEASRNTANEIHAAIFQVDNSNTYILGFEDLRLCSSDKDYQDMIVSVTINSTPVPEPGTMLLLGLGMAGLAVYGKRRQNKQA